MTKSKHRSHKRASKRPAPRKNEASMPDLFVEEGEIGRSTLHAIFDEIQDSLPEPNRERMSTLGFDEGFERAEKKVVISKGRPHVESGEEPPEVVVRETRAGFETLAVIKEELGKPAPVSFEKARSGRKDELRQFQQAEVLEVFTFVVLNNGLSPAATEEERKRFVRARLWHRLPAGGVERIRRVEIRAADDTSTLIRVWVDVPKVQ